MTLEEKWKWFEENNTGFPFEEFSDKSEYIRGWGEDSISGFWSSVDIRNKEIYIYLGEELFAVPIDAKIKVESDVILEDYFLNWKSPTEKELNMFEMLFGVKLLWSVDNPLKFPE